jgi:hypothetical protein
MIVCWLLSRILEFVDKNARIRNAMNMFRKLSFEAHSDITAAISLARPLVVKN